MLGILVLALEPCGTEGQAVGALLAAPCLALSAWLSTGLFLLWPRVGSQPWLPPSNPTMGTVTVTLPSLPQGQHKEPCPGPYPAPGLPGSDPGRSHAWLTGAGAAGDQKGGAGIGAGTSALNRRAWQGFLEGLIWQTHLCLPGPLFAQPLLLTQP